MYFDIDVAVTATVTLSPVLKQNLSYYRWADDEEKEEKGGYDVIMDEESKEIIIIDPGSEGTKIEERVNELKRAIDALDNKYFITNEMKELIYTFEQVAYEWKWNSNRWHNK